MDTQNKYSFFASVARSHFEYNSLWKCIINERKNKPHSHFVIKNSWIPSPCKKSRIVLVSIRLRLKNINSICVWFIRKVLNPLTPCSCFSNEINHLCVAHEQVVIGEKSARGLVLGIMSARLLADPSLARFSQRFNSPRKQRNACT